jgi:hypothetical protein
MDAEASLQRRPAPSSRDCREVHFPRDAQRPMIRIGARLRREYVAAGKRTVVVTAQERDVCQSSADASRNASGGFPGAGPMQSVTQISALGVRPSLHHDSGGLVSAGAEP